MTIPALPNGWADIQADPSAVAHARRVFTSVGQHKLVKYLSEFVTLTCAPDMLALRLFPNGKEISESFAAFDAVRYRLRQFALDDPGVTVVCVGDGRTPRTAATFALRTRWTCYSVDPGLKGGTLRWSQVRRLHVLAQRIEEVKIAARRVILVAVHSHAKLHVALRSIDAAELAVVAIPCCVPQRLDREPDLLYDDDGIISPCRTVKIWYPERAA